MYTHMLGLFILRVTAFLMLAAIVASAWNDYALAIDPTLIGIRRIFFITTPYLLLATLTLFSILSYRDYRTVETRYQNAVYRSEAEQTKDKYYILRYLIENIVIFVLSLTLLVSIWSDWITEFNISVLVFVMLVSCYLAIFEYRK